MGGIVPSFNYDDIINLPYPHDDWNFLMKHPRMSMETRAKIFNPFAALRGHDELIGSTAKKHLAVSRDDLMEDGVAELDDAFLQLTEMLDAGASPMIAVTFFVQVAESSEGVGEYKSVTGVAKKVDMLTHVLFLGEAQIPLADVRKISILE